MHSFSFRALTCTTYCNRGSHACRHWFSISFDLTLDFGLSFFFRHRQFLYRYKNSWKRCNQPQSSRCNSIFFDFIFVTVIVIVDAILVFDGIFENCAAAQQFMHCTVFDLAICCVCRQFCSIFFLFDLFFRVVSFVYCLLPYCTHTQAHAFSNCFSNSRHKFMQLHLINMNSILRSSNVVNGVSSSFLTDLYDELKHFMGNLVLLKRITRVCVWHQINI